jgi:hypothetical protein
MQLALIVIVATILWSSLPKSEGAQKKRASPPIVMSGRDSILIHIKMCQFRIQNSPVPRAPAQPGFGKRAAVSGHCKHRAARRSARIRAAMVRQLADVLAGYEDFHEFDARELHLVEALRLIHYSAWIARCWDDPAFAAAFPWFNTQRYWQDRILELCEQIALIDEPPLWPA